MVRDNPALNRFELDVDGAIAFSAYRRSEGVVTFTHTEVPESFRGRGVGSELARGALELVRARGEKIVPRCPFIRRFVGRHPEFQDLVVK